MTDETKSREILLKGIAASPGICIGKAYLVDREGVDIIKQYLIDPADAELEKNRFKTAVKNAKDDLRRIIQDTPEEFREHASILETHEILLKDKMLYGKTIELIERRNINAEWALKTVVSRLKRMFNSMDNPYFRERSSDIVHVSDRIMAKLVGIESDNIKSIDKRVVLVAPDLSPAETSQINLERIKGFVTDGGGVASHTGIIARSLQIPAVLGLNSATAIVQNDDIIVADGSKGLLIVHPTDQTLVEYEERNALYEERKAAMLRAGTQPAVTADELSIPIMANIELPQEIPLAKTYGADGIGLYRTEFQYLKRAGFPDEETLFQSYKSVVEAMAPNPVTIRTLDINGDKALRRQKIKEEANPALGLRAIRYCLANPDVFITQLRAILRASAYGRVRILLPMISSVKEVREAREYIKIAAVGLQSDGIPCDEDLEVGIMIEVPAAVVIADLLAEEADFFSIGTNDLIQYTLAIDRGNRTVSSLHQPLHPAVLRMLKQLTDVAKRKKVKLFMCGEMGGNPLYIPMLMAMGVDELSMTATAIPRAKKMIQSIRLKEVENIIDELLKCTDETSAEEMLESVYGHFIDADL